MNFQYFSIFLLCLFSCNFSTPKNDFNEIVQSFEQEYSTQQIQDIQLSYVENLINIQSLKTLARQETFFKNYFERLAHVDTTTLTHNEFLSYQVMRYEIDLNLERIQLEKRWKQKPREINGQQLINEELGKEFYCYFLKKWVDRAVTPEGLLAFGQAEIETVKQEINSISDKVKTNTERDYYLKTNAQIVHRYNQIEDAVNANASNFFPYLDKVDAVSIQPGSNPAMRIVPAYYSQDTFYYNHFDSTYDTREMGWIYLHEAIPGHHYQGSIHQKMELGVRALFYYMGYTEGWGAYVEQFGYQLGAFHSDADKLKQLNWDLIRSTRVCLDVGINYLGWSDEQAFQFWQEHIQNQDNIGWREIARIKRWPAQVVTYKYGKSVFNSLKQKAQSARELKQFHQAILDLGPLPLSILQKQIKQL